MSGPVVDRSYPCINVRVESPDGTMFVTIMENEGMLPFKVLVHIGKSGSSLAAWANCAAEFVSEAIPRLGFNTVIARLLGITSDKVAFASDAVTDNGIVTVKSGPEAIAYALIKYRLFKYRELNKNLGLDEDGDEDNYRGPSAA